ncbi:MAG: hypothetical protein K2X69_11760 [Silvanigrellaceae bacterium]|nr:hypothetical protein [Silvanigrellaceae bacterium]
MKKSLIAIAILFSTGIVTAEYILKYGMEESQGGVLPNDSIIFFTQEPTSPTENWITTTPLYTEWVNNGEPFDCTNWSPDPSTIVLGQAFTQTADDCQQQQTRTRQDQEIETTTSSLRNVGEKVIENQTILATDTRYSEGTLEVWIPTTPLYTEWVDKDDPFDCTNWSPDPSTVALGQTFTQTADDCKQQQTRTRQDQEIETTTASLRNVGEEVIEYQDILATDTRDSEGTLDVWGAFANSKGLSKDWNTLSWSKKSLTSIPSGPYPLTSVEFIYFNTNNLTNLGGLSNLRSIGSLWLQSNKLTNVDELSNLTNVGTIIITNNQLTNINGLANVKASLRISIDSSYSGPKLASTTRFCFENATNIFQAGATKTQLCNP